MNSANIALKGEWTDCNLPTIKPSQLLYVFEWNMHQSVKHIHQFQIECFTLQW